MRKTLVVVLMALGWGPRTIAPGLACTVFTASGAETVLFGNNEDSKLPFTRIWFLPAEKGKYGRVYLGFDNLGTIHPQGGVNDQGLAFDILAAPKKGIKTTRSKKPYLDTYGNLIVKVMEECATVEEAISLFNHYQAGKTWSGQYFLADKNGDAAIIEIDAIHRKKNNHLVATNFYQSQITPQESTCPRFKTATTMLESGTTISINLFKNILQAVHMEGETPTQYSNIIDLRNGTLFLYQFHDFDQEVFLNIKEELSRGRRSIEISSLFPKNLNSRKYKENFREPVLRPLWDAYRKGGISDALYLYRALKTRNSRKYDTNEWLLKVFGWELADQGEKGDAVKIFELVASEYPDSADAHEKLGWGYWNNDQFYDAIMSYEKSLTINPENKTAKLMLKRLRMEIKNSENSILEIP